jgi:hypothetical protein
LLRHFPFIYSLESFVVCWASYSPSLHLMPLRVIAHHRVLAP